MNTAQQQAAIEYATQTYCMKDTVSLDVETPSGSIDETEEGAWLRAWVWVPKESIPGYQMPPPSPPAEVVVPMAYPEFRTAYIAAYTGAGDSWTVDNLRASWEAYQRNPAGHFITKHNQQGNQA